MRDSAETSHDIFPTQRLRVRIHGAVQGVGFRPFIYRLANELRLVGWVRNSPQGVIIEVEGTVHTLNTFLLRLSYEKPPLSSIQSLESSYLEPAGFTSFDIHESSGEGAKSTIILPDIATCPDCLSEILDPGDRRYRYPFTNCTNCGPRYSIIRSLPYDRAHTTMAGFTMCASCRREYEDPGDRRFHAQPNACPECGPHLEFWDAVGTVGSTGDEALTATADAIRGGAIAAVKGIGGFHLIVDARNADAVDLLRSRKHREEKPLAVMAPSLESVDELCSISDLERRVLTSVEAPIVLLRSKAGGGIAANVAPRNPFLGVMLPYSPLHHLLMRELGFPVVATSGNASDEPICIDEVDALERLAGIADIFLVHNRPIERYVDDSIVRVMMRREMVMRRSRGFAPLPVAVSPGGPTVLATGAHLKNTIGIATAGQAFISQHIGDLETKQAFQAFDRVLDDIEDLYDVEPEVVAHDLHPEYSSTKWAMESDLRRIPVQHHLAHILSCMAENEVSGPALGIAWDGTGLGTDGTIWGGEFLIVDDGGFERAAHLRTYRLPGGDQAVREPRRSALGVLYEIFGEKVFEMRNLFPVVSFSDARLRVIRQMLSQSINTPITSSAGRLFDAVASMLGLRERVAFEGQAAMELEFMVDETEDGSYEITPVDVGSGVVDWGPLIHGIFADEDKGVTPERIAARFHNTLVEMMVDVAAAVGEERVILSGGCFQNRYLTERAVHRLRRAGHQVFWHQRIPTNDGGISLGQIAAALRKFEKNERRSAAVCV